MKGSVSKYHVRLTDLPKELVLISYRQVKGAKGCTMKAFKYWTGLTWKDQNLGRKVEVIYMDEPCNAC